MNPGVDHIKGETFHARHGSVENAFRYKVDYLCFDLDREAGLRPAILRRNRRGLVSLWDRDHGGAPGKGRGGAWVRGVLEDHRLDVAGRVLLVAQPRVLGHVFNPVSFWLCYDQDDLLRVVIAEVTNTYGDRHSYICHRDDLAPISPRDVLTARKIFHVSPFQPVEGQYAFRFDIREDRISIRIDFRAGNGGVYATLRGKRVPATSMGLLAACLRRPLGSRRVLGLIHWQALKLWWKGAAFRHRPEPPAHEVTR